MNYKQKALAIMSGRLYAVTVRFTENGKTYTYLSKAPYTEGERIVVEGMKNDANRQYVDGLCVVRVIDCEVLEEATLSLDSERLKFIVGGIDDYSTRTARDDFDALVRAMKRAERNRERETALDMFGGGEHGLPVQQLIEHYTK